MDTWNGEMMSSPAGQETVVAAVLRVLDEDRVVAQPHHVHGPADFFLDTVEARGLDTFLQETNGPRHDEGHLRNLKEISHSPTSPIKQTSSESGSSLDSLSIIPGMSMPFGGSSPVTRGVCISEWMVIRLAGSVTNRARMSSFAEKDRVVFRYSKDEKLFSQGTLGKCQK